MGEKMKNQSEIAKIFKNAKVQYSKDPKQNIYSVKITLNNKPRIITVRVGDSFTELSLADQEGNVLEMLREDNGKTSFTKF